MLKIVEITGIPKAALKTHFRKNAITIPMEQRQANATAGKTPEGIARAVAAMSSPEANIKKGIASQRIWDEGGEEMRKATSERTKTWWENVTPERLAVRKEKTVSSEGFQKYLRNQDYDGVNNPKAKAVLEREGWNSFEERMQAYAESRDGKFIGPYIDSQTKTWWECAKGHKFEARPVNLFAQHQWCAICVKGAPSSGQKEIAAYVTSLGFTPDIDKTGLMPGSRMEIDVWEPTTRFGIEFDGLLWHSDKMKDNRGAHLRKALACRENNIKLLAIYSDEWADPNKQRIVKSMIRWRLGKFEGQTHRASKLELKAVEYQTAKAFFEANHLDSNKRSGSECYGLWNGNELIMCASVGKTYKETELARMATAIDHRVHGGAAKLLGHIKTLHPEIISFSNNRLGEGAVYEKTGATLLAENPSGYWYTDGAKRYPRTKCMKVNPVEDPDKITAAEYVIFDTEAKQALGGIFSRYLCGDERPLYRVEDYGNRKWKL